MQVDDKKTVVQLIDDVVESRNVYNRTTKLDAEFHELITSMGVVLPLRCLKPLLSENCEQKRGDEELFEEIDVVLMNLFSKIHTNEVNLVLKKIIIKKKSHNKKRKVEDLFTEKQLLNLLSMQRLRDITTTMGGTIDNFTLDLFEISKNHSPYCFVVRPCLCPKRRISDKKKHSC